jgi:hypothetical protein
MRWNGCPETPPKSSIVSSTAMNWKTSSDWNSTSFGLNSTSFGLNSTSFGLNSTSFGLSSMSFGLNSTRVSVVWRWHWSCLSLIDRPTNPD